MKYLIIYVSFVFIGKSFSQENEVAIIKDSRIDALVNAQSEIIPPEIKPQVDGYRIQLFFDSDKEKLNASRSSFILRLHTERNSSRLCLPRGCGKNDKIL